MIVFIAHTERKCSQLRSKLGIKRVPSHYNFVPSDIHYLLGLFFLHLVCLAMNGMHDVILASCYVTTRVVLVGQCSVPQGMLL